MSNIINSAGWSVWQAGNPQMEDVDFAEYGNTGAGSVGKRANFSTSLGAPISIATILGGDYASWVDTSYLSS